jgi:lysine N6-hydroxylase
MTGFGAPDPVRFDLVGVGIGPFNLSLASLAEPLRENHSLSVLFLEEGPEFSWHPGMMVDGAKLQVPFLADLVSLTDPTSRFSVLNWLHETGRLFSFYFAEDLFLERREYEAYCRWVAAQLPYCEFGARVTSVRPAGDVFEVEYACAAGVTTVQAANVVLGIGSRPQVPPAVGHLLDRTPGGAIACHSADYLPNRDELRELPDVTVVGSGQSGAEIVLDLLRTGAPGQRVRWLTRSTAFEPMEYSKLGLEHFTPDYTRYFRSLAPDTRADLLRTQGRLHKAVSVETLADLHAELHARSFAGGGATGSITGGVAPTLLPGAEVTGGAREGRSVRLDFLHARRKQEFRVRTKGVVFATGYTERAPAFLDGIDLDNVEPDLDYRIPLPRAAEAAAAAAATSHGSAAHGPAPSHGPGLYVQNAERRSHGVGAPDLGLGAHRAAVILNAVTGRQVYGPPGRAAHTSFDPAVAAASDPGVRLTSHGLPLKKTR